MWTFGRLKASASPRGSVTARAALVSLAFISVVPFVPACGAPPNDGEEQLATNEAEELAANGEEESLVTSDAEDGLDPGAGDVELGTLSQALTVNTFNSDWTCSAGTSCEDTYDFNIPGGTRVRINMSSVGTQVVRMAALGPGGGTINLLTNGGQDWRCSDSNSVLFVAPTSGDYRLKIGRDASSGGTTGTYTVRFEGDPSMTFLRQSGNNTRTTASTTCGWSLFMPIVSYSCREGQGCNNVFDFDVPLGADITMQVMRAPSRAAHSMSLYGPGTGPGDNNLLRADRGARQGWRCAGQGADELTKVRVLSPGRHRFAVTYEPELSNFANSGSYQVNFAANTPLISRGQTVTNGPRLVDAQAQCGFVLSVSDSWGCAGGDVKCVDVFGAVSVMPTTITQSFTILGGGSTGRLAVRQTPQVNALNGLSSDRQCRGPGVADAATTLSDVQGNIFFTWGRSRGERGETYLGRVESRHPLTPATRTINDGNTNFNTSCP